MKTWQVKGEEVRPLGDTGSVDECRDCGGPLVQAFATSEYYLRCRRCGHVFDILDEYPEV